MEKTVLVTGASGNLGREVVKTLSNKGYNVKAAMRDSHKISSCKGVTAIQFDYTKPSTFAAALDAVEGLVLVAPPMDPEAPAKLIPFVKKAREAGVEHVVFVSALGVDQNEQAPLRVIERALMDSGLAYTILRPNFFMENFSTGFIGPMIKQQNGIFLAAGDGKTSFISTRDIAEVAATAFSKAHYGKEYNLTGPEALDHSQAAKIIAEAIGRKVTYHALSEEVMLQGARDQGMPEGAVQYLGILYAVVRAGYMAVVTDDMQKVTGRKPVTFAEFARQNASCWR
jgi:uncharacterized protein YbjT (DUF2867 family)